MGEARRKREEATRAMEKRVAMANYGDEFDGMMGLANEAIDDWEACPMAMYVMTKGPMTMIADQPDDEDPEGACARGRGLGAVRAGHVREDQIEHNIRYIGAVPPRVVREMVREIRDLRSRVREEE